MRKCSDARAQSILRAVNDGQTARLYHRLSSFGPSRGDVQPKADHQLVLQHFVANEIATWPAPCKSYPAELPVVALPREWPLIDTPATAILAGRPTTAVPALDLATIARILHLSAGVVRSWERPNRPTMLFRAAGSAGGRFPLEVYLSARGVESLEDGVHWYNPVDHAFVQIGPAAEGEASTLVVTGIPWRTGWRYAERGLRHIYWDAGSVLGQTIPLAESAGLEPRLWTRFPDADVSRLVGADGVQEFPVALVSLGQGRPAIAPTGEAGSGAIDAAAIEFPLVTLAQHAGDLTELGKTWPVDAALDGEPPPSRDLDAVILQRGSTRLMDPTATVPEDVFRFVLAASLRGTSVPHFVAVHGVDGVEPGLYRWPHLDHPIRRGQMRDELLWVCWDMNLGRDAAFVVIAAVDLEGLDDRGYREAQLDAGIVEGRLHLAAFALGIGASGMTFLDSEIEGLLGEPLAGLLFTCVGVPTYENKAGGPPGRPVSIVISPPGETPASPPTSLRSASDTALQGSPRKEA
jgi:SagB-type dehydrogenase family enzyme